LTRVKNENDYESANGAIKRNIKLGRPDLMKYFEEMF
jgi:hypothetical protein